MHLTTRVYGSKQIPECGKLSSTLSESDLFVSSSDRDIYASSVGMTTAVMCQIEADVKKTGFAQHGTHKLERAKLTRKYVSKSEQSSKSSSTRNERSNVEGVDDTNEPLICKLPEESLKSMVNGGEHASVTDYIIFARTLLHAQIHCPVI